MKRIKTLILVVMALAMAACSTTKEVSQADMMKHDAVVALLNSKSFLIKADRIMLNKRTYQGVSSNTNFVMVDGDNASVQVSPGVMGGPNGVGGFTMKGLISGYESSVKANGAVSVKYNVQSVSGSCTVFITLPKNGVVATVSIRSTFHSSSATLYGEVSEIDNSVYVGRTRY